MRIASFLFVCVAALAHDAPAHVTVQIHARPVGTTMHALVRIPLEAVRDVDFPAIEGGYLDLDRLAPQLPGLAKIWIADPLELYENDRRAASPRVVATQISIASDRSFATYEQASAHFRDPMPSNKERLFWKQVFFDVALDYSIASPGSNFSIRPAFAGLGERVQTVLHYRDRTLLLPGEQDLFPLDPSWTQTAWQFIQMGFLHILGGTDHLLFLFCLVIPSPRFRPLVAVVTAFTVAHSITLAASVLNMAPGALWFPPLVELGIAVSIVTMALANIFGFSGGHSWILAFAFGLVHGFGFSFALRESLQFAGPHLAAALLCFNLGVELGQLAALAVMVPMIAFLFVDGVKARLGSIVLSSLVAHTAWHWMLERWGILAKYSITWSSARAAMALRWILLLLALGAILRLGNQWLAKRKADSVLK